MSITNFLFQNVLEIFSKLECLCWQFNLSSQTDYPHLVINHSFHLRLESGSVHKIIASNRVDVRKLAYFGKNWHALFITSVIPYGILPLSLVGNKLNIRCYSFFFFFTLGVFEKLAESWKSFKERRFFLWHTCRSYWQITTQFPLSKKNSQSVFSNKNIFYLFI